MSNDTKHNRRKIIKMLTLGLGSFTGIAIAGEKPGIGAMIPGKGWKNASTERCPGDGTPLQFLPKTTADASPLTDELKKYPKCPYCGMDRGMFHHSRHLVQYDDDLVDGTCSIHCLAISLSLNLDRGPKAIYAADFGSTADIKLLVDVDKATYLLDSKLKATMAGKSKMAFSSADRAKKVQAEKGGKLGNFNDALMLSYQQMADDTVTIRQRRAEKRKRMMKKKMK